MRRSDYCYKVYGMAVGSEIELPGLPVTDRDPEFRIQRGTVPDLQPGTRAWCAFEANETFLSNRIARFAIRDGREITVEARCESSEVLLRGLLKGKVMSLALRQRGWLPLHASAIEIGGKAVLFMGASGAGKSTLAASFDAKSYRLLADDVVGVRNERDGNRALPGFQRIRLDEAAASATGLTSLPSLPDGEKRSVDVSRGQQMSDLPVDIRAIVGLEYAEYTRLARADLPAAATMIDRHVMLRRLIASAPNHVVEAQLRQSARIAASVPVYRLCRPKNLASLTHVRELIEGCFGE